MKEEDSSTDTSDAEGLGRIVEDVAVSTIIGREADQEQTSEAKVHVSVRPRQGGGKAGMWWTADSGVKRTLLAEKDWGRLKVKNPNLRLKRNHLDFRPYGTKITLTVMGKVFHLKFLQISVNFKTL